MFSTADITNSLKLIKINGQHCEVKHEFVLISGNTKKDNNNVVRKHLFI